MAVMAHDGARRMPPRILAVLTVLMGVVMGVAQKAVAPHKASIANLKAIPLTVAGTGCIDFAAFHVGHGWGWLVTGVSLVLLEHIIADSE